MISKQLDVNNPVAVPEYIWHIHIDRNRFGLVLFDAFQLRDKYPLQNAEE
jgi:hypothetical protein